MKWFCILIALLLASNSPAFADSPDTLAPYITKRFVILKSTKDFGEAKRTVEKASKALNLRVDLRDLDRDKKIGLTFPAAMCEQNGWSYPCYVARGRYDDGSYLSIEYSSQYEGFEKELYIVIAASGIESSKDVDTSLGLAKVHYPDAYAKTSKVFVGCIH